MSMEANSKNKLFKSLSISLFLLAWMLYLAISPIYTIFILVVHYASFFFLSLCLYKEVKKSIPILLIIYIISIFLDGLYNIVHKLDLSFIYYLEVNLIHIIALLFFYAITSPKGQISASIQFIVLLISMGVWMFCLDYIHIVALLDIITIIIFFQFDDIKRLKL